MEGSERFFLGLGITGFHRVSYTQWGKGHNKRVLICVHGLSRNGRDFDDLAFALSDSWHVLCPDMIGGGKSQWLTQPEGYSETQYMNDCATLIARSGATSVDWVGTSMGGIIGMKLAAQHNTPIRRLVLNDVGPLVPREALKRLRKYLNTMPVFPDLLAAETYLYKTNAPFIGHLTTRQWQKLAQSLTRPHPEGKGYVLHYDPGILLHFPVETDIDLWKIWDSIRCPVLTLRGESSDVLTVEITEQMKIRGPRSKVAEISGCGHAPSLMEGRQIELIRTFLMAD